MLATLGLQRALPGIHSVQAGVDVYYDFKNYQNLEQEHGVVGFELAPVDITSRRPVRLAPRQSMAVERAMEVFRLVLHCRESHGVDASAAIEQLWHQNKIQIVDGPPGTGKTFVQRLLIENILEEGGRPLLVFLTANGASRAREVFGDLIDIDTFHGALGDGKDGI
eukprot:1488248-Karenia_brevis.AAC.1